jgi:solute:Na+ symporter, SSS family
MVSRHLYFAISPLIFRPRLAARFFLLIITCQCLTAAANDENQPTSELGRENQRRAVSTLQTALRTQPKWARIHAAEFLLARGYPQGVADEFLKELETSGNEPQYRIGIWRVLARTSSETGQRNEYIEKIRRAAIDPAGIDRLHAVEALAKLGAPLNSEARATVDRWTRESNIENRAFGHWLLAVTTDDPGEFARHRDALVTLLASNEPLVRLRAAYSLRQLRRSLPANQQQAIFAAATRASVAQPADENTNLANAQILITGWSEAKNGHRASDEKKYRSAIERLASADTAIARFYVDAVAELGNDADVPQLTAQLDSADRDLASSAANALLLRLK